jgi:hypothetical protein
MRLTADYKTIGTAVSQKKSPLAARNKGAGRLWICDRGATMSAGFLDETLPAEVLLVRDFAAPRSAPQSRKVFSTAMSVVL